MSLPSFRIALPRAINWRVDLRLDPRLESSATTASHSHQTARRHLIDILGRRFAAEKWDMRGRCPSRVFGSRCRAQSIGGSTSGLTQDWKAPLPPRPAPTKLHAATSSTSSDAASRLINGTCEDDVPPGFSNRAAARVFTGSKAARGRFWAPSGG